MSPGTFIAPSARRTAVVKLLSSYYVLFVITVIIMINIIIINIITVVADVYANIYDIPALCCRTVDRSDID